MGRGLERTPAAKRRYRKAPDVSPGAPIASDRVPVGTPLWFVRPPSPVSSLTGLAFSLPHFPALTCRAFLFRRFAAGDLVSTKLSLSCAASDRASLYFLPLAGVVLQVRWQFLLAALVPDCGTDRHL